MNKLRPTLTLMLFAAVLSLTAQNECSELLQYGIYNHFQLSERVSSMSKLKSAIQNVYAKYEQDKQAGAGEGQAYFDMFGGSASYSREQIEGLYKLMNGIEMSENELDKNINVVKSTIDPHILNAYNECRKLSSSSGLKIKASMSPDNVSAITFDVYFRDEWAGTTPTITGIETKSTDGEQDCFSCEGDLLTLANEQATLNSLQRYSLTCYRQKLDDPRKTYDGRFLIAEEGLIKIKTTMGNYTLWVPAVEQRREIPRNIGEVVASMLTEEQFMAIGNNGYWVLADGREIGSNNEYFRVTNKTKVPDLRGVFLRGANNGRTGTNGNPEDKELGQFQKDAFQGHKHKTTKSFLHPIGQGGMTTTNINGADNDKFSELSTVMSGYANDGNGNPRVTNETRPKNVTINFFIKIN